MLEQADVIALFRARNRLGQVLEVIPPRLKTLRAGTHTHTKQSDCHAASGETRPAHPIHEVLALSGEPPQHASSIVLDHQNDDPLSRVKGS